MDPRGSHPLEGFCQAQSPWGASSGSASRGISSLVRACVSIKQDGSQTGALERDHDTGQWATRNSGLCWNSPEFGLLLQFCVSSSVSEIFQAGKHWMGNTSASRMWSRSVMQRTAEWVVPCNSQPHRAIGKYHKPCWKLLVWLKYNYSSERKTVPRLCFLADTHSCPGVVLAVRNHVGSKHPGQLWQKKGTPQEQMNIVLIICVFLCSRHITWRKVIGFPLQYFI